MFFRSKLVKIQRGCCSCVFFIVRVAVPYGAVPEHDAVLCLIRKAYELGCTLFDTAETYGTGHNELLVGDANGLAKTVLYRGEDQTIEGT